MIDTLLRLLSQERAAFQDLARRLRTQRAAFTVARGDELTRIVAELAALEAPRAAAAAEFGAALTALARRLGVATAAGAPRHFKPVLAALPPRDRERLRTALAATRAAAEDARLQIAVGERLLQFATEAQEGFLRDLLDCVATDIQTPAMVDVKG